MWLRARDVVKGVVIVPNSLISFYICGRMCQKSVLRVGTSNCIPQVLWDVILYPFPRYPLLAKSSFFVPDVLIVLGENNSFTLLNGLIHGMYLHCNTNFQFFVWYSTLDALVKTTEQTIRKLSTPDMGEHLSWLNCLKGSLCAYRYM